MMSNYQRTMELTGYATNSAGASQKQFEKTLDSLESKLNRLHDAWEQFTTGIANQSIIKGAVDLLTNLLTTVNNVTDALDPLHTGWSKILAAFLGFKAAKSVVNGVLKGIGTQLGTRQTGLDEKKGAADGTKYGKGFWEALRRISDTQKMKALVKEKEEEAAAAREVLEIEEATLRRIEQEAAELDRIAAKKREQANKKSSQFGSSSSVAQYANSQAIEAENKAIKANSDLKVQNEVVSNAQADVEIKEAAATDMNIVAKESENKTENAGLLTKAKYYAMMLFGSKTTRESARQSLANAGSKFAEAGATNTATGAQWALNAAMMACPVGWILAAIAAIVAAVAIFAAVHETTEEKVERLNKSVEQLGEQMKETQETINNLSDSWDELKNLEDELDKLTVGTIEWKKKLLEVNQQVLNLLDTYPQLAQYALQGKNGKLEISTAGYNQLLEEQLNSLKTQQAAYSFGQALASDMENQQQKENIHYRYSQHNKETQQIRAKDIQTNSFFEAGVAGFTQEYSDKQKEINNELTEQERLFIQQTSANKKSLERFEQIKKSTEANTKEYAELAGLTEKQVKKKKEEGELDDDAIKTLIATNKYQKEYEEKAGKMLEVYRKTDLNGVLQRSISGVNTMTKADLSGKDIERIFSSYITDGQVNLRDEADKAKKLLIDTFKFDENTQQSLNDILQAGASLEDIIQNLVNSQSSLDEMNINLSRLTDNEKTIFSKFTSSLESINGDLSNDELEQLSRIFSEIAGQGGDILDFSKQLELIVSRLKKPEDLKDFLQTISDIDFTSETKIKDFTTNLESFGIVLNETVTEELIQASNAARDFDMSNVAEQLKSINYELTDDIQDRILKNNKYFSQEEYEKYEEELAGYPELLDKFIQLGNKRIYAGDLKDIKEALNKSNVLENENIQLQNVQYEAISKQNRYNKLKNETGTIPSNNSKGYNQGTLYDQSMIWDLDGDFRKKYFKTRSNQILDEIKNLDFKTEQGKQDNYLNSLLYTYDESGNLVAPGGSSYAQYNGYALDTSKIAGIILKAQQDKKFAQALPEEFYKILEEVISLEEKNNNNSQYSLQRALNSILYNQESNEEGDLKDFFSARRKEANWASEQISNNEAFLMQYREAGLITQDEVDEWKKLTIEEISKKLEELDFSPNETSSAITEKIADNEEQHIQSLTSAREILDFNASTAKGLAAQKKAVDALVSTYDGYEKELKRIKEQYHLSEEAAKKYLIIQKEQETTTDDIINVLSDYKNTLSDDNIDEAKGTSDYTAAIEKLTEKFKILFGENITSKWVEDNLDNIKKLSKGGDEAKAAYEALANTSEASWIKIKNVGDAEGEKITSVWDTISTSISDVQANIGKDETKITSSIEAIDKALTDLDGSDATIAIKANTRMAALQAVQDSLVAMTALYGDALASGDIQRAYSIAETIKGVADMATQHGFSVPGLKIYTNYDVQKGQYYYDLGGAKNFSASGVVVDLNPYEDLGETEVKGSHLGSGFDTNNFENEQEKEKETKTSDWTNDWDRQASVLKQIEALERKRNQLDKQHQRYEKSSVLNEAKILKNKKEQLNVLQRQVGLNQKLVYNALANLRGLNNNGNFDGAVWFDEKTKTLMTNDEYILSMDEDTKKAFDKEYQKYTNLYNQLNTAEDNINNAIDAMDALTEGLEKFDATKIAQMLTDVIDHTIAIADASKEHLQYITATAQNYLDVFDVKSQALLDKADVLDKEYAQLGAEVNSLIWNKDYSKYFKVDWEKGQIEYSKAYYGISDPTIQKKVADYVEKISSAFQRKNQIDEERLQIQNDLDALQKEMGNTANEWQKKVYDAVVKSREEEIENLNNINTSINNAAAELVSSIQKNIQKIRQDRQNKKTEEKIQNTEAKLAYLQVDTSNANQKAILDTQKSLEEQQQSYTDSLIDQKISELQEQNTEAEKQRKQQIEIMQAQLDYDKQTGAIWTEVRYLIANGLSSSGLVKSGSKLDNLLKKWGSYDSLSDYEQRNFTHDQNAGAAQYYAYNNLGGRSRTYAEQMDYDLTSKELKEAMQQQVTSLKAQINNILKPYSQYMKYDSKNNSLKQLKTFIRQDGNYDNLVNTWYEVWNLINQIKGVESYYKNNQNAIFTQIPAYAKYAEGGLADFTGPAWLDGTKSSPELVLNAKDTENFIQLKDILSNVMKGEVVGNRTNGDFYFDITIDVDHIDNDYDIDRVAARIKQQITNEARYRNVNTINMIR